MSAYYLGKNTTGDLASLMSGAYNMSGGSAPVNTTTTPAASLTGASTVQGTQSQLPGGNECEKGCANRYRTAADADKYTACIENCQKTTPNPTPTPTPTTPTTSGCPAEASGSKAYEGCSCGEGWSTTTPSCPSGYVFIRRNDPNNWKSGIPYVEGAIGTCQCQKAIDDWKANKSESTLGEYEYPAEIQELMDLILGRSKDLLGTEPGYSQEAIDAMFGKNFETIRGTEGATRNTITNAMAGQGMLGTGALTDALTKTSWNTEKNIADTKRDLLIANEDKKKEDLINLSTAAQSLFGSGLSYQQLLEAINSSRRGESSSALAMLLALYQSMASAAS